MSNLVPFPIKDSDDNGTPLAGGMLYSYEAGTSTPKPLYSDPECTTQETNPIVLSAGGRIVDSGKNVTGFMGSGLYKLVMKDAEGVVVWHADNISGGGGAIVGAFAVVETLGDLRALDGDDADAVYVLGHTSANGGGGGFFYWVSDSTETDDNGVWVKPDSNPVTGRWQRINFDAVDLRMFGAIGDGSNDDSAAIAAANTYAVANEKTLLATAGTYLLDSEIAITAPVKIDPYAVFEWAEFNLAINAIIDNGDLTEHFDCDIDDVPALTGVLIVRPEWFGSVANGSIQKAIDSVPDQSNVQIVFQAGKTYLDGSAEGIIIKNRSQLVFQFNGAKLQKNISATVLKFVGCTHIDVNSLLIVGLDGSRATHGIWLISDDEAFKCSAMSFNDVYIEKCETAISLGDVLLDGKEAAQGVQFDKIEIVNCDHALMCNGTESKNIVFNNLKILSPFTDYAIKIIRGIVDINNMIVDASGTVSDGDYFCVVSDGAVRINDSFCQLACRSPFMYLDSQTEAYTDANQKEIVPVVLRNTVISGLGSVSWAAVADGTLIRLGGQCRALHIDGCTISAPQGATNYNVIQAYDKDNVIISVGSKYGVASISNNPFTSIFPYNITCNVRSVGDKRFAWADDGDGNYIESAEAVGDLSWEKAYKSDKDAYTIGLSSSIADYGRFISWKAIGSSNAPYTMGRMGIIVDSASKGELDVYLATPTERKLINVDSNGLTVHGRTMTETHTDDLTIASATTTTLGRGNYFKISGTTIITRITGTGWVTGSIIVLEFTDDNIVIGNGDTVSGEAMPIYFHNGCNNIFVEGSRLTLLYMAGEKWVELSQCHPTYAEFSGTYDPSGTITIYPNITTKLISAGVEIVKFLPVANEGTRLKLITTNDNDVGAPTDKDSQVKLEHNQSDAPDGYAKMINSTAATYDTGAGEWGAIEYIFHGGVWVASVYTFFND